MELGIKVLLTCGGCLLISLITAFIGKKMNE